LDGGTDGLEVISSFLETAPEHLAPGGLVLLEIESSQGEPAKELSRKHFPKAAITLHPDLAGLDRLLKIQT
jgi:release factor glutamine methyltransferase